jgi:hypothetical protein
VEALVWGRFILCCSLLFLPFFSSGSFL